MSATSMNVIKCLLALVMLDLLYSNTRKFNVLGHSMSLKKMQRCGKLHSQMSSGVLFFLPMHMQCMRLFGGGDSTRVCVCIRGCMQRVCVGGGVFITFHTKF